MKQYIEILHQIQGKSSPNTLLNLMSFSRAGQAFVQCRFWKDCRHSLYISLVKINQTPNSVTYFEHIQ